MKLELCSLIWFVATPIACYGVVDYAMKNIFWTVINYRVCEVGSVIYEEEFMEEYKFDGSAYEFLGIMRWSLVARQMLKDHRKDCSDVLKDSDMFL